MERWSLWQIEMAPWYALGIYWILSAMWAKRTRAKETALARIYTACLASLAFGLLFSEHLRFGRLGERFLVRDIWIEVAGVGLTYAGAMLAFWARWSLGGNWSAEVTLKKDHQLIRSGPYAYVRHPIYSGLLLAVIGTAIVIGEWRGLLAIVVTAVAHALKAKREEAVMVATFGERYRQLRNETGFLLPRM